MSYNHNASQKVSDFITQNILSGEWKSGDKIWSENEFCSYLGVSRIAVRDAIANLTAISVLRKVQRYNLFSPCRNFGQRFTGRDQILCAEY